MEEQHEERQIGKLLTLPYSEMTEEEIDRVVSFKAEVKADEAMHKEQMAAMNEAHEQRINERRKLADETRKAFNEYLAIIDNEYMETL